MNEQQKARLDVLSIEMETVSLLGHTAASNSPYHIAAKERETELKREISLLHTNLTQGHPDLTPESESNLQG